MIAKVVPERGHRTRGLIEYLWGPGQANEHTAPRVVAAWEPTWVRGADEPPLDEFERKLLAYEMEAPLRLHGIEPGEHVYHVPVSIPVGDGELTDEQWCEVAEAAAEKLGLTAGPDRSPAPWFAMRHGRSADGNDHIHFVVCDRRESGQRVEFRGDFFVWEQVRHNAEARWNLTPTPQRGGGLPGHTRGELEKTVRQQRAEPPRQELGRLVRSAATAAQHEAEFVGRLRRAGVLVRPRWAEGGQTHVVGYSVALRPEAGHRPTWYGGGSLAADLRLSAIRQHWGAPSEEQAADALRAWRPRGWRALPTGRQLANRTLRAEAWNAASSKVASVRQQLSTVPPGDPAWFVVARDASGALGALAARVDLDRRGELRRAAAALGRAAQVGDRRPLRRPDTWPLAGVVRAATDAMLAAQGGTVAVATLVIQLGRLVQAVSAAYAAAGHAAHAHRADLAATEMLAFVRNSPTASQQAATMGRQHDRAQAARPPRGGPEHDERQR